MDLRLLGMCFVSVFVLGTFMGMQATFDNLIERGMFSDSCTNATAPLPCPEQKLAMSELIEGVTSATNIAGVFMGILVDFAPPLPLALIASVLWTISTMVSGIDPTQGFCYTVGMLIAVVSGAQLFMIILARLIPALCDDPGAVALWSSVMTLLWDLSGGMGIGVGYYVGIRSMPLWLLYLLYGVAIGVPLVAFWSTLLWCFPIKEGQQQEGSKSESQEEAVDPFCTRLKAGIVLRLKTMSVALRDPVVWAVLYFATCVVTLGYFILSNVGTMMRSRGATLAEEREGRQVIVYLMAGLSPTALLPGFFGKKLGPRKGLLVGVSLWVVLVTGFFLHFGPVRLQYVAMALIAIWRVIGFAIGNASLLLLLGPRYGSVVGTLFGLVYTLAGIVSMTLGEWLTNYVHKEPQLWPAMCCGLGGAAILAGFILLFNITRASESSPEDSDPEAPSEHDKLINTS